LLGELRDRVPELARLVTPETWNSVLPLVQDTAVDETETAAGIGLARLFAGFAQLLGAVAARRPLLIVVEDVHWADASSMDLLGFLARKLRDQRLLILITNRSTGTARGSHVRHGLAE